MKEIIEDLKQKEEDLVNENAEIVKNLEACLAYDIKPFLHDPNAPPYKLKGMTSYEPEKEQLNTDMQQTSEVIKNLQDQKYNWCNENEQLQKEMIEFILDDD